MKLGVVAFLNSQPLIEGLKNRPDIEILYAVPAALTEMLRSGKVGASLIPVIDLARSGGTWERVSDACIASFGETMTVRVFSRVVPERIDVLHADTDSHTSVALARLVWKHGYRRDIHVEPLQGPDAISGCQSVLLIGDKVVTTPMDAFPHHVDLGHAWKEITGLPFVFAVWAAPIGGPYNAGIGRMLSEARDRGVERAAEIAIEQAGPRGWPSDLAVRYLTQRLQFTLTPSAHEGMERFLAMATAEGLVLAPGELVG